MDPAANPNASAANAAAKSSEAGKSSEEAEVKEAPKVKLVKMTRSPMSAVHSHPQYTAPKEGQSEESYNVAKHGPTTADVHPDEVENYQRGGWQLTK